MLLWGRVCENQECLVSLLSPLWITKHKGFWVLKSKQSYKMGEAWVLEWLLEGYSFIKFLCKKHMSHKRGPLDTWEHQPQKLIVVWLAHRSKTLATKVKTWGQNNGLSLAWVTQDRSVVVHLSNDYLPYLAAPITPLWQSLVGWLVGCYWDRVSNRPSQSQTHSVAEDDPEFWILLLLWTKYWDYRNEPPHLAYIVLILKPWPSHMLGSTLTNKPHS